jgi:hypothetical protein
MYISPKYFDHDNQIVKDFLTTTKTFDHDHKKVNNISTVAKIISVRKAIGILFSRVQYRYNLVLVPSVTDLYNNIRPYVNNQT